MRALVPTLLLLAVGCGAPAADEALPLGPDAASCGGCHEEHTDQWATSPHARSVASPVFRAMLPDVEAAWGARARRQCEGCHAPEHSPDEGIGCLSCHAAVGNHAERDGMLAVDPGRPLAGPLDDPEPTVAHRSRDGGFLASPSLCGTCHELTGPRLVDEPTLTEYRASPQAAEGLTCADCHLPDDGTRPLSNDATRPRPARSHRFVGFDPPWGAPSDEASAAAERTRALLASALDLRVEPVDGGVEVTVSNVGAGHAVPTGATFLRDLWVDVEVDGALAVERVLELGDQPMRGGEPVALLTDADRVEKGSLAAGESRRVFVPVAAGAPVTARLRGRAIRDSVLEALALADRRAEVPTHEIASASTGGG
ncbi:MAG TPA: multiheme c-type cytochrome [Sandaracinaceae bacterium LLY-WYZ-13_1]|nr:multiheme c-type cytochrome [Sandaracinaceae bacterium LLY-WYZ-13_1]